MSMRRGRAILVLAAGMSVGGLVQAAIWTGDGDGTWGSADNWQIDAGQAGDTVPPAADGYATFAGDGSTIAIDANYSVSSMAFTQAGSSWTINGPGKLTLASVATPSNRAASLTVAADSQVVVNAPFGFSSHWDGGRTQVNVGAGSTLQFNNSVTGSRWTEKRGAGTLDLNTSASGTFQNLSVVEGTVILSGSVSPTSDTETSVSAGGTLDVTGANASFKSLSVAAGGTVTNTGDTTRRITTNYYQANINFVGNITGNLHVTWRGQTININNDLTYTGDTTIYTNTKVMFNSSIAAGYGNVLVQDNAVIGGTGTVLGTVTFAADGGDANNYGAILRPSSATDPLTLGGIIGAEGAALDLVNLTDLNPSLSYQLVVYGGTPISGFGTILNKPETHELSFATAGEIWLVPVPEPGVVGMIVGVGVLALGRRRRSAN